MEGDYYTTTANDCLPLVLYTCSVLRSTGLDFITNWLNRSHNTIYGRFSYLVLLEKNKYQVRNRHAHIIAKPDTVFLA